jgi:hypothetical protein
MEHVSPGSMQSRAAQLPIDRPSPARIAALVLAVIAVVLAIAAGIWLALRQPAGRYPVRRAIVKTTPLPPPLQQGFLPIDRAKAELVNAGIAVSTAPIEPARPFAIVASKFDVISRQSAVDCLTAAVYYEAASEDDRGQRAVAQVVLNRVRHPAFPKSVCGVVYEGAERRTGCQFSFTCDGSLARKPSQAGWERARKVAFAALGGFIEPSVGTATHYHTVWVVPYWAYSLDKITTVGAHIFYRWPGYWGRRAAFNGVYAGEEAMPAQAAALAQMPMELSGDPLEQTHVLAAPRLLADELGNPSAAARAAAAPAGAPRADQESGTLVVDENPAALIGSGPKGN